MDISIEQFLPTLHPKRDFYDLLLTFIQSGCRDQGLVESIRTLHVSTGSVCDIECLESILCNGTTQTFDLENRRVYAAACIDLQDDPDACELILPALELCLSQAWDECMWVDHVRQPENKKGKRIYRVEICTTDLSRLYEMLIQPIFVEKTGIPIIQPENAFSEPGKSSSAVWSRKRTMYGV